MSLVFAALIEAVTVICAIGILFAGGMRTTGSTGDDSRTAITVFACGTVIAAMITASHWLGW